MLLNEGNGDSIPRKEKMLSKLTFKHCKICKCYSHFARCIKEIRTNHCNYFWRTEGKVDQKQGRIHTFVYIYPCQKSLNILQNLF